jgi:hypothetical protein
VEPSSAKLELLAELQPALTRERSACGTAEQFTWSPQLSLGFQHCLWGMRFNKLVPHNMQPWIRMQVLSR